MILTQHKMYDLRNDKDGLIMLKYVQVILCGIIIVYFYGNQRQIFFANRWWKYLCHPYILCIWEKIRILVLIDIYMPHCKQANSC